MSKCKRCGRDSEAWYAFLLGDCYCSRKAVIGTRVEMLCNMERDGMSVTWGQYKDKLGIVTDKRFRSDIDGTWYDYDILIDGVEETTTVNSLFFKMV